jgi:hypothetical protein
MEQEQPFEIIYLFQTKAVSCYGCGLKYKRDEENNTLVVRKFCEREFTTAGQKKSHLQFAYFHLLACRYIGETYLMFTNDGRQMIKLLAMT